MGMPSANITYYPDDICDHTPGDARTYETLALRKIASRNRTFRNENKRRAVGSDCYDP
jgi:hypothetical protein